MTRNHEFDSGRYIDTLVLRVRKSWRIRFTLPSLRREYTPLNAMQILCL
jgi:hypothetical protein